MDGGYGIGQRLAGWAAHLFTATGVVFGLAALLAAGRGEAVACFAFLGLALLVDALDGAFARLVRVREVVPRIDGAVLDLVVDYLTYVLVPAVFVIYYALLPDGFGGVGAAWMLLTALYCFANTRMKSADHYFVGFPAIWNVVVLYLWILELNPWINAGVVVLLGLLTFTRVTFLHPLRVRALLPLNIVIMAGWLASAAWLVAAHPTRPMLPFVVWLGASAYYAAVCAWRTVRGKP